MTGLENTTLYNEDMKGHGQDDSSLSLVHVDSERAFSAIRLNHSSKATRNYSKGFTSTTSMISSLILFFVSTSAACR